MRRTGLAIVVIAFAAGCTTGPAPRPPDRTAAPAPPSTSTTAAPAYLTGSRIAAMPGGALVIDADTGSLLSIDEAGRVLGERAIGRRAGQLVFDPIDEVVFVADRMGDRIVAINVRDRLSIIATWRTPAEPYGVALTPDRRTLLVTTIADRTLIAYAAPTGGELWRTRISPGARGVSVSPNGELALVSTIASGSLDLVEVTGEHRVAEIPYDLDCERCQDTGAFARGSGAVRFVDANRALATYQRSIPEALLDTRTGLYGGGSRPPITQHVAFFTFSTDPAAPGVAQRVARVAEHQLRAFVYDQRSDTAYLLGMGSDTLLKLPSAWAESTAAVEAAADNFALASHNGRCGPEGAALTEGGDVLAWCAFTRSVLRLHEDELRESPPLIASAMTPAEQRGQVLFYGTTTIINRDRALACSSCHPDGGADGLSWKIGTQALQTPVLAGRVAGTHPYKWDGSDATLVHSFATTVRRLGGAGLSTEQAGALAAYLQSLPAPRVPTRDPDAIARGRAVFEGVGGCTECHGGDTFSDGQRHAFTSTLVHADTPSLVGLAASAPYYHDGSAPTLDDLVAGGGTVHGMSDQLAKLSGSERADLRTFLESL